MSSTKLGKHKNHNLHSLLRHTVDVAIQCITIHSTKGQKNFRDDVTAEAESNDFAQN